MAKEDKYPSTKEILYLLGMGTLLVGSILMPGLSMAGGAIIKAKRKHDFLESQKAFRKFNLKLLKRNINRLKTQKIVEIVEKDGQQIIKLTKKGKTKYLKFRLEELSLKGRAWDGKWRVVMYDINKYKKSNQNSFRWLLKQIRFLQLQKSVYLTPYPCQEEVNYLREYFNLSSEVLYLEVNKLENEQYYKEYFGL